MQFWRCLKVIGPNGGIRARFSQYGEDVILHKIIKKTDGFYMDVGAHHPFRKSNTAYLWCMGWNGVNVDANPRSIKTFEKVRKKDVNIWGAVLSDEDVKTRDTIDLHFSKKMDLRASVSPDIVAERAMTQTIEVPVLSLTDIVNAHAPAGDRPFDFLNIDIEGLDQAAIAGIQAWRVLPSVIAIETYETHIRDILKTQTSRILETAGYALIYQVGLTSIYSRIH